MALLLEGSRLDWTGLDYNMAARQGGRKGSRRQCMKKIV